MLIDSHVHLEQYPDREQALSEIISEQIVTVAVSMDIPSYEEIRMMSRQTGLIIPCFGIHPWEAHLSVDRLQELVPLIDDSPMIGEVGLDYLWADEAYVHTQRPVFEFFCEKAAAQDKPMNIHTKDAEEEVLSILKEHQVPRPLIHWYSGPDTYIEDYLSIGCYFTLSVNILDEEIPYKIPLDRILLETDNPGGYSWLYDRPGRPGDIISVYEKASKLYGLSFAEFASRIDDNWNRLTRRAD